MKKLVFSSLFFLSAFNNATYSAEVLLEAFGDSLTAGFLSETSTTIEPSMEELRGILSDFAMYGVTRDYKYIAKHEHRGRSWPFFLSKIIYPKHSVFLENLAVTGARTHHLQGQVGMTTQTKVDGAFFFIGHNDLCEYERSEDEIAQEFLVHYTRALQTWDTRHEDSTAYILPIGEVYRVYENLTGHVWYHQNGIRYQCEDSWRKIFPYCVKHAELFRQGKLKQILEPRLHRLNSELEAAVLNRTSASNNRFKFIHTKRALEFSPPNFAIDCYHLSEAGQMQMANIIQPHANE